MYHNLGNMLRLTFFAFFSKQGNHAHKYTMEHILLSTIHTIASMQIISHSLRCEKGCGAQARRLIDHPYFSRSRVWGSQFDTMFYLPPHSVLLSKHYQVGQILRYISFTIIMCILIISSTNKILEHQVHFWSHRSCLTTEEDNKIYLSERGEPSQLSFSSITPHSTSRTRAKQVDSQQQHSKGLQHFGK